MTRSKLITAIVCSFALATTAANSWAGCGGGGYYRATNYHHTHVVQPVHVQRTVIAQPIVKQVVQPVVQVAAAPVEPQYPEVPAGSTMTLPGNFLGDQAGSVFMVFKDIKLPVQIQNWTMTGVTITLPPMAIKDAVLIRIDVVRPDGSLAHSQKLHVTAPAQVILHPTAPTSPLPTNAALQAQSPVSNTAGLSSFGG
ncbi:MAG: hypothetical protein R3C28_00820 [Pirellulaceae bacterium]